MGAILSWKEITQKYPDKWALMKDMVFTFGNLEYAEVIYAGEKFEDVDSFTRKNPERVPRQTAIRYTGEAVTEGIEYDRN